MQLQSPSTRVVVDEAVSTWRGGGHPDAREYLSRNPEVRERKSVVVDLAYEEYCMRVEAGEAVATDSFCEQFPAYRSSIRRAIEVHEFFHERPELLPDCEKNQAWPQVGETFLDFELLEELGRGSFARVFLARQPRLGNRHVAVKISPLGGAEAHTLGKLKHRHIVPVFSTDFDEPTGMTSVCMPYIGCSTLTDVLDLAFPRRGIWPRRSQVWFDAARRCNAEHPPQDEDGDEPFIGEREPYVMAVVRCMEKLALALDHAHRQGVLHRDLKPSNVLLTPSGRPMLLDFNLSADPEVAQSRVGGTLVYMAPEQIREVFFHQCRPAVGCTADVFSIGVMLYELLQGEFPFGKGGRRLPSPEQAQQLLDFWECGARLHFSHPDVDAPLQAIMVDCLAVNPFDRPPSAEALAERLAGYRRRRLGKRRRLRAASFGGVAAVAITATALAASRPDPPGPSAWAPPPNARAMDLWASQLGHLHVYEPTAPGVSLALGMAHLHEGEFAAAVPHFQAAEDLGGSATTALWLGYSLLQSGQPAASLHWNREALQRGTGSEAAVVNLAYALQHGEVALPEQSVLELRNGLQRFPGSQAIHHLLALVEWKRGEMDSAVEQIDLALACGGENNRVFFSAALIHAQAAGRDGRATVLQHLRRAVQSGYGPTERDLYLFARVLSPEQLEEVQGQARITPPRPRPSLILLPPPPGERSDPTG